MDFAIFHEHGAFAYRWLHFFFGITWIGLLYYFNFVQTPFFAETDAGTKSGAIQKLVPRALWWFRWGAAFTFLTGLALIYVNSWGTDAGSSVFATTWGIMILPGAAMGILMFLNVWLIIWPAQKIVIASTTAAATGGKADPRAADAGARASVASRTNTLFSIPLLFFMGAAHHLTVVPGEKVSFVPLTVILAIIIGAIEANAIVGKLVAPLKTVRAVITSGFVLTAVLYVLIEVLIK